ncbi:MAG: cox cluster protein [Halobacteriaceae archaeon]
MAGNTDAHGGVSDQYPRASPWPLFVALGFVLSELGVLFNALSVAVGGLALFSASVVGIFRESGYARTLWRPTATMGAIWSVVGVVLFVGAEMHFRAAYVGAVGGLLLVAALGLALREAGRL